VKTKKYRNILCVVLTIIITLHILPGGLAKAYVATEETDFHWEKNEDGTVCITGVVGGENATRIEVPRKIEGREVTTMEYNAFQNCGLAETIVLPDTVRLLSGHAFFGTYSLKEIIVDAANQNYTSVDGILYGDEMTQLVWVPDLWEGALVFPDSVIDISADAFVGCTKLESVYLHAHIQRISPNGNLSDYVNLFRECSSLKEICVAENHPDVMTVDGVLFSKDGKLLLSVPAVLGIQQYEVPEGVEEIAWAAFYGNQTLEKVSLPESVKSIGPHAFRECVQLQEVVISEGLETLGEFTFSFCPSLEKLTLPTTVETIGESSFFACPNLKSVIMGEDEKNILEEVKQAPEEWENPEFAEEPKEPAESNGRWTENEPSVLLEPLQEKEYASGLFQYRLTEMGNLILTGYSEEGIQKQWNQTLAIPAMLDGKEVAGIAEGAFAQLPIGSILLPEGLKEIGKGSFYGCSLKGVSIPSTITYIGERAFGANYGLTSITVSEQNTKYYSENGVLYNKDRTMLLQVPANIERFQFVVPNGVYVIGDYAFGNNRRINHIELPESLVQVMDKAFWDMECLTTIMLWEEMEYVAEDAFEWTGCEVLKKSKGMKLQ